jgi:hypothetical protein
VSCPQPSTGTVAPAAAVTADPLISRPVAVPLPSVAWTLLAVTTPSNNETELSETPADLHVEPLDAEESKATTDPDDGYPDGPSSEAGVPSAITRPEGATRAAAPAPTQPAGNEDDGSGANDGVVVVEAVVPVVVVLVVVVLVVPPARADATPTTAPTTAKRTNQTTRRITKV